MRPTRIDQVVHILAYNDAIGTHVLNVRDTLRRAGYESDIYSGEVHPELKDESRPVEDLPYRSSASTWLLFHHSIGSTVAEAVLRRSEPLIVDYHNITPPHLVDRWAPWVREELELGLEQLGRLAPKAFFGVAHSRFSERELNDAGCSRTTVVPPLFSLAHHRVDPTALAALHAEKSDGGSDWLFVGRISPHKAQHDLIKALASSRQLHGPGARLHLVGTSLGEDYPRALQRFAERLGVADGVRMTGAVSADVLSAYYDSADVFVCTSDHEGFCVPIVEAMGRGIPVVAYDAAAVGETVGGAGIVVRDKSPVAMATAVDRVTSDPMLSRKLAGFGRERAAQMTMPVTAERMIAAIDEAIKSSVVVGIT